MGKAAKGGFSAYLRGRSAAAGKATKGGRTRDRIVAAAADLLASGGFHKLRTADIAKRADVATASIYQYFKNKTEITLEVMTEFLKHVESELLGQPLSGEPYADILDANLRYVALFRENAGLMRCLRALSDEMPRVRELTRRAYAEWRRRLARNLMRWSGAPPRREPLVNLTAHALSVMVSEFLYDLYVRRDATLADWADEPEELAKFFAAHWHRAALGDAPEPPRARKRAAPDVPKVQL